MVPPAYVYRAGLTERALHPVSEADLGYSSSDHDVAIVVRVAFPWCDALERRMRAARCMVDLADRQPRIPAANEVS